MIRRHRSSRPHTSSAGERDRLPPARRSLGQNFLVDAGVAGRIVGAAGIVPGEPVLEIGPGRGALTGRLVEAAGRVAAIEKDRRLAERLRAAHPVERLVLVEGDVLALEFGSIAPRLGFPAGTPLVVVGNLPYNVSKPVAMKVVAERAHVRAAILMFQREVADRLTSHPGGKTYGPLTVLAGRAFRVERIFDVPPGAFRPSPNVVSSVTRWMRLDPEDLPEDLEPALRDCLRTAFARRRRTILANLREAVPGGEKAARELLRDAAIEPGLRAEAVAPDAFVALARIWPRPA